MFGPLPFITFIRWHLKLPDNLWKVRHTDISNGIPFVFVFIWTYFGLIRDMRSREVTKPFPDITKLSFGFEYVIIFLSRLPNFNKMSKVIYLTLTLISICLITLWRPQFFHVHNWELTKSEVFLTCEILLPLRLPRAAIMINRRWCYDW